MGKEIIYSFKEYQEKYSSSLEKIKLPDDILVIGESAFEKTLYLKNIIIPASIKKLSIKWKIQLHQLNEVKL